MVSFKLHFQLHSIKSLIFCYIVSFNKRINFLDKNNMSLKVNYLTISKLPTACFYHKSFRSYKLLKLNMTTPRKRHVMQEPFHR